jgi:hydrogenase nickel incorporation protein HypB
MHKLDLDANLLQANEEIAAANRQMFQQRGIFVVNVMSAPGAGKTSVLEETIKRIEGRYPLGVIEGDLHTTADADRIGRLSVPAFQITTGTVCHLDARMVHNALDSFPLDGIHLLFIENVGNLVCPAEFFLGEDLKVMVCSIVEGAEKPKKYPLMFHEADAVLVNKMDLAPYAGADVDELCSNIAEVNPEATIFLTSCRTGAGIELWVDWLSRRIGRRGAAETLRHGEGESERHWENETRRPGRHSVPAKENRADAVGR